jgi:hypothetical protein
MRNATGRMRGVVAFSRIVRPIYMSCVSAILAACSGSATPGTGEPAPISRATEPAACVAACVVRGTDPDPVHGKSPPQADSISIAGDEVKLCWNARPARTCWRIDVAKKVAVAQAVTSDAPGDDTPRFVQRPHAKAMPRADSTISLCGPGGAYAALPTWALSKTLAEPVQLARASTRRAQRLHACQRQRTQLS